MSQDNVNPDESKVVIEVWGDIVCPWCYIAKHRLEAAVAQRPDADRFAIQIRSFELYPDAPKEPTTNEAAFLRTHPGTPESLLQGERQLRAISRMEGHEYVIDRPSANTFDVHRVTHYADEQGVGYEFFSRAQDGLFTGTSDPWDPAALAAVGESVGLDGERVRAILASDEYADQVRADRNEALGLGITGVPFIVVGGQVGAPGAQKVTAYAQMLEQVAGPAVREGAA